MTKIDLQSCATLQSRSTENTPHQKYHRHGINSVTSRVIAVSVGNYMRL